MKRKRTLAEELKRKESYLSHLEAYCYKLTSGGGMVNSRELAEEIFDDYIAYQRYEVADVPMAYMCSMARNRWIECNRKSPYYIPDGFDKPYHESYDDVIARLDYTQLIMSAPTLTPQQRQVLLLHCIRDLDIETVARILHTSVNTVNVSLCAARRKMREHKSASPDDQKRILLSKFPFFRQQKSGVAPASLLRIARLVE